MSDPSSSNTSSSPVILITGAYGDLGQALSIQLAESGADLILLGRKTSALEKLYDELSERSSGIHTLAPLNLETSHWESYQQLVDQIIESYGRLDGLIHCAAYLHGLTPFVNLDPLEWYKGIQINLHAPVMLTKACLSALKLSPQAEVVFITDRESADPYYGAYGIAKQGLHSFANMLAAEFKRSDAISFTTFETGPMKTALRQKLHPGCDETQLTTADKAASELITTLSCIKH